MILVTGANGLVGSFACRALVDRGQQVRALVRRSGTAPDLPGVTEVVGEFDDPTTAAEVVDGVTAVVTTVAPMGADHATQHRVTVDGTMTLATAARDAGVARLVHVSTCAVYDRRPGQGDADEDAPMVGDDAGAYAVTKRDADLALTDLDGITRVLVRPPAILGPGETSVWNTLRPADVAANPDARRVNPDKTFAWVHVGDLARFLASMAAPGPAGPGAAGVPGPREGTVTAVNVAGSDVTWRDYMGPVADAVGVTPAWTDEPAWTGAILATRARSWGWHPTVDFATAMGELVAGLGETPGDRA
ncbi:MAG TPA: NAD-dependent epimerase/dehydratase family protein [Nitriliruptoraceae bacterium]|nr:NAD-dependent epimerase/dehydratase family protein [Nitriliruptoraceae bacterium]